MIPWNYNVYGIATADYLYYTDENPIGTLLNETTYGYFYDNNPLYSVNRDIKLDESIYLWHIGAGSSAGTNAAFCLSTGDTLELQCAYNQPEKVPLAMQLCNVDTRDFYKDPKARLCYDFLEYTWVNYYKSKLFVDINRTKFCINPRIRCYNTSNNAKTTRTLTDIVSYINGDPEHRYVYLMYLDLYNGDNVPRGTETSYVPSESLLGNATPDILIDRPIPDNATAVKLDLQYLPLAEDNPQETWIDNKQYSPFTQAIPQAWYDGVLSLVMPYCIGELLQNTVSQIRTGRKTATYNNNRITGGFMHVSTKVQEFEDVVYQWQMHNIYEEGFVELTNGFPLDTLTSSHHITTVSLLHIIDMKDSPSMGVAVQRALKHEIAFLGYYFADSENEARNATLGTANEHIFLPEFIGGITTGRYFTGDEIPTIPYANATDTSAFKYVPELSPDEEIGENETIVNSGTIGSGATYYALTNSEMNELSTWLNTTYEPTDQDTFIQDFKGTDPANYITTVMYYPFDIPLDSGADIPIVVGKLTAGGATGRLLYYKYGDLYNFGSYNVPKRGDWLDYLCKTTVFIPFCGSVDLDPIMWAGHTLTVKMAIDWPTGVCTAFLYRDNGMIDSLSGSVGVPLPLSSVANGSYQVAITNLLASHKAAHRSMITGALGIAGGAATAIGGAAGFNPKLAIGGLLAMASGASAIDSNSDKMDNIDYNIDHTQPRVTEVSGGSPFINCGTDYRVKILRTEPLMMDGYNASVYGRTIGFADCRNVPNLSKISGFVQCTNIDTTGLGVPADLVRLLNIACQEGLIV